MWQRMAYVYVDAQEFVHIPERKLNVHAALEFDFNIGRDLRFI